MTTDENETVSDAKTERGDQPSSPESAGRSVEQIAGGTDPGLVREFVWFLRYNKKWWMTPIVVILLLLVGLAFLTTSPIGPFIYTLF